MRRVKIKPMDILSEELEKCRAILQTQTPILKELIESILGYLDSFDLIFPRLKEKIITYTEQTKTFYNGRETAREYWTMSLGGKEGEVETMIPWDPHCGEYRCDFSREEEGEEKILRISPAKLVHFEFLVGRSEVNNPLTEVGSLLTKVYPRLKGVYILHTITALTHDEIVQQDLGQFFKELSKTVPLIWFDDLKCGDLESQTREHYENYLRPIFLNLQPGALILYRKIRFRPALQINWYDPILDRRLIFIGE